MSAIALAFFISAATLMVSVNSASEPGLELKSLCVMKDGVCWTDHATGELRALSDGDYSLSSKDLGKITNKLKQCGSLAD